MADDLNVVYRISADIAGLEKGVNAAVQSTDKLEKSATDLGAAFDSSFQKIGTSAERGIGTVTAELLLAEKEVKNLQKLVLENADKQGFVAALGYELDTAIPKVVGLEKELAGLKGGLQGTTQEGASFTEWLGKGNNLLATFGAGLGIASVVAFGKSLITDADALVKLSDKTGVSLQGLQKFQIAGDEAGNTVDQLTNAIAKMEDKLVSGDKSALAALTKLQIPFEDIKNLNPENQFIAISDAIRKIQDPAEQVKLAVDLFGKSGAEVLPTLKRGFDDVKNSVVGMSDETIKAFDKAGDEFSKYVRLAKGYSAELIVAFVNVAKDGFDPITNATQSAIRDLEELQQELTKMTNAVKPTGLPGAAPLIVPTSTGNAEEIARENARVDKAIAEQKAAREKAAREQAEFEQRVNEDTASKLQHIYDSIQKSFDEMMKDQQRQLKLTNKDTEDLVKSLTHLHELENSATVPSASLLEGLGEKDVATIGELEEHFRKVAEALKAAEEARRAFNKGLNEISTSFNQLASISGQALGGIIRDFAKGADAIAIGYKAVHTLGDAGASAFSKIAATTDLISAGIQTVKAIADLLKGIGGPSQAELAGRNIVAGLEQQFGSTADFINRVGDAYETIGKTREQAQKDIKAAWDAERQGAEATTEAVNKLNEALKRASEIDSVIGSEGIKSHDELVHAADIANAAYEKIAAGVATGQYTAEQATKAYLAYQQALADSGDAAAQAWIKAHDAATAATEAGTHGLDTALGKAETELQGLISQHDQLTKGIAAEAPEAVKGVIQTQQEAALKVLDAQIADKAAAYEQLAKDTGQSMADAIVEALKRIQLDPLHLPVILDLPNGASSGGGIVAGGPAPGSFTPGGRTDTSRFTGLDYNDYFQNYHAPDREYVLSQIPHAATGGMVTEWGISRFMTGLSRGSDTVPAMLTPGEMVLTQQQQGAIGEWANQPIHVTVQTLLDGQLVAENTVTKMAQDKRGLRTKTQRALGVR